ncbi:T9SS type A sorting domain-containing protein [uncultured Hymenobacter sp.]|uniref:T9SS type A sorting domain-containing protein n=1 Tax=uncultured Hymenobacter sp. TaxID=170016 RepID=UPI0035CC1317
MTVAANPNAYYVDFPFDIVGPLSGIYASVTATSAGGTSPPTTSSPQSLPGRTCGYVVAPDENVDALLYPNPATDQVTLRGGAQEAQAAFYDSQGVCRKVVALPGGQDTQAVVNLRELPAGLYYIHISAKDKALKKAQLIIEH